MWATHVCNHMQAALTYTSITNIKEFKNVLSLSNIMHATNIKNTISSPFKELKARFKGICSNAKYNIIWFEKYQANA